MVVLPYKGISFMPAIIITLKTKNSRAEDNNIFIAQLLLNIPATIRSLRMETSKKRCIGPVKNLRIIYICPNKPEDCHSKGEKAPLPDGNHAAAF